MANVFSTAPPEEDDDDQSPGIRVAGALTGDGEDTPETEESPQAEQPKGTVDDSGQSYLTPAGADGGEAGPPQANGNDVPVSADTKAYMQPVAAPTLAKPADYADHSADTAAMTAQKAAEARENVKPSVGRKILAALSAGAAGFGSHNSEVGARIGQEILAGPRTNAETRWATQEAPIQAKLNADQAADAATRNANVNTEQSNRLAETNYSNQIRGQQDAARAQDYEAKAAARNEQVNGDGWKADTDNPLGSYTATTIGGKTIHSATAPAAIQNTADYRIADAAAKGHPFTTEQQQILRGGGKLTFRPPPNPRNPAVGELEMQAAKATFRKQYGRDPQTLDEQNQVVQAAKGTFDKIAAGATGPEEIIAKNMQDKQDWVDSLETLDHDVLDNPNDPNSAVVAKKGEMRDAKGNLVTPKQFQDKLESFRTNLNANPVMRKSGTMVNEKGETVNNRFSRNPQTSPAPNTVTPSAGPQPQGMIAPGNVDLSKRPNINNGDGTHSSVFSMGFNVDGKEVLVPGVGDGKTYPLRKLSTAEALDQYKKTGANLGTFKDVASSNAYAQTLHEDQAKGSQQQPTYKAKSGASVTVGTRVIVNGRPGVVDSFDAKGKPVVKY